MTENIENKVGNFYNGIRNLVGASILGALCFVGGYSIAMNSIPSNKSEKTPTKNYEASKNSLEKKAEGNVVAYTPKRDSKIRLDEYNYISRWMEKKGNSEGNYKDKDLKIKNDVKEETKNEIAEYIGVSYYTWIIIKKAWNESVEEIKERDNVEDLTTPSYVKSNSKIENIDEAPKAPVRN